MLFKYRAHMGKRKQEPSNGCGKKRQKKRAAKDTNTSKKSTTNTGKKSSAGNKEIVKVGKIILKCGVEKEGWDCAEAARLVRVLCRSCKWKQKKLTAFICKRCNHLVSPEFMEALLDGSNESEDDKATPRNKCCLARLSASHIVRMVRARSGGRTQIVSILAAMVEGGFLDIDGRHSSRSHREDDVPSGLSAILGLLNANWKQGDVQLLASSLCDCAEDLPSLLQILQAVALCEAHALQSSQVLQLVARIRASATYKDLAREYEQHQRLAGTSAEAESDIKCEVCGSGSDEANILLCGDGKGKGCDRGFHMNCMSPPLKKVPKGDWYCKQCQQEGSGKKSAKANKARPKTSRTASDRLLLSLLPLAAPLVEMSEQRRADASAQGQGLAVEEQESDEDEKGNLVGFVVGDDDMIHDTDDDNDDLVDADGDEDDDRTGGKKGRSRADERAAEVKGEEEERAALRAMGQSLDALRAALSSAGDDGEGEGGTNEKQRKKANQKKKMKKGKKARLLQLMKKADGAHSAVARLQATRLRKQMLRRAQEQRQRQDSLVTDEAEDSSEDESEDGRSGWGPGEDEEKDDAIASSADDGGDSYSEEGSSSDSDDGDNSDSDSSTSSGE